MAKLVIIDLDLELDHAKVYADILDTIKYLEDVKKSLEQRVLNGEEIQGLKIVEGRKSRYITDAGFKYLEATLGRDKVYETIEKPITITKLETLVDERDMAELITNGYIDWKKSAEKVVVDRK